MPILLQIDRYTKEPQIIAGKYPNSVKKSEKLTNKKLRYIEIIQLLVSLNIDSYIFSALMTSCLSSETSFPFFLKVTPQKRPQKLTKHKGEKKSNRVSSILHSKCEKAKVGVKKLVGLCFLSPLAGSRNNCVNSKDERAWKWNVVSHIFWGQKLSAASALMDWPDFIFFAAVLTKSPMDFPTAWHQIPFYRKTKPNGLRKQALF